MVPSKEHPGLISFRMDWLDLLAGQGTLKSPLDHKEMQAVHSEGDQPWDFLGRNDAKVETPGLWPPHVKS